MYVFLQEYALVASVGRRIEKLHAVVKKAGSGMYGAGLPYLNAVTREHPNLQLLQDEAGFRNLCISQWRSRSLLKALLKLRFTVEELKAMPVKQQIESVYQCSIEMEYTANTETIGIVVAFEKAQANNQPAPEHQKEVEQVCLNYFKKSVFVAEAYYRMPYDVYNAAAQGDFDPDSLATCAQDCLDACMEPDVDVNIAEDAIACFMVTDTTPEKRHIKMPDQVARSSSTISVVRCTVMFREAATRRLVVAACLSEGVVRLHLRVLMASMRRSVRETFRWQPQAPVAVPSWRPCRAWQGARPTMPHSIGDGPPLDLAVPAVAPTDVCTALQLVDNQEVMTAFLQRMTSENRYGERHRDNSSISFMDSELHRSTVANMAAAGFLHIEVDEFAEWQISLRPEAIDWRAGVGVERPLPVCRCGKRSGSILKAAKLELMIALIEQGWTVATAGERLPPVGVGVAKVRKGFHHPLSYYAALVRRTIILQKIESFEHGKKDGYYRCLLNMNADQLRRMFAMLAGDENDNFFKKQMADNGVDDESSDSREDDPPPPVPPVPGLLALPGPVPVPHVAPDLVGHLRQRCWALSDDDAVKVYFDNFTGGSGRQRAYCCCTHHVSCTRWRDVHRETQTLEQFCATMHAWNAMGPDFEGRVDHMGAPDAPQDAIDATLAILTMAPF